LNFLIGNNAITANGLHPLLKGVQTL